MCCLGCQSGAIRAYKNTMSRQNVTPKVALGCLLCAYVVCASNAWAQAKTPLRALEAQLGISYDGVVPVLADAPSVSPNVARAPQAALANATAPVANQAASAAAPTSTPTSTALGTGSTPVTAEQQQKAKLAAMRALVGVPTAASRKPQSPSTATGTSAPTDPFEQQLAAIRQALVDEALKGPTRVVSTAWVDQDGRLHENMEATNGMKVRGVRVLDYLDDGKTNMVARIDAEQQQAETPQARRCAAPEDARWAQHVSFVAALGPGIRGEDMHYATELLGVWRNAWVNAANAQATRWRQSVLTPNKLDAYQAALQGDGDTQMGDWQLRLVVRAAPPLPPVAATRFGTTAQSDTPTPAKVTQWQTDIELTKRGQPQPLMRDAQRLTWSVAELGLVPPDVPQALIEQIRQASVSGVLAMNAQMACEPVQFSLLSQDGADLVISGGSHNGLRVGDRLVLVDSKALPKHVLHAGVVKRMALAQVAQVGIGQSTVRQVAGPTLPAMAGGAWVAMPY